MKYADDFVIVCKTKGEAQSMYEKLQPYLDKRGLTLAEDKIKVTHISQGFDFLGSNLNPKKSFKWIYKKYFKADYTGVSKDRWLLTDPHDNKTRLIKMGWIPIVRHSVVKYRNSPDDASLKEKEYFDERDRKEFKRGSVLSRKKLAKCSNYKCRVCGQSLVSEEPLRINQIVSNKVGGDERYDNLELLHKGCHLQHQLLLEKYGGGRDLPRVSKYFESRQVNPNSTEGYKLMRKAFKKFKYQTV